MNTSEQINELAGALARVQAELRPAKMNAVNPFLKNKYADLGSVMDAARALLAANGLAYVQMPALPPQGEFGISLTTRLMHTSGQWLEDTFFMPMPSEGKSVTIMQVAGSAITYARRYALASMLGVVADEDTDGNAPPTRKAKPTYEAHPPSPDDHNQDFDSLPRVFQVGDIVKSKSGKQATVTAVTPDGLVEVALPDGSTKAVRPTALELVSRKEQPRDEDGIPYTTNAYGVRQYHGKNAEEALLKSLDDVLEKHHG